MKELEKIFDRWYTSNTIDTPETKKLFCTIMEMLYKHCEEEIREILLDDILSLMEECSKQGFSAGYKSSFTLFMELIFSSEYLNIL